MSGNPKHDRWIAAREAGASKEEAARAAVPAGTPPQLAHWAANGDKITGFKPKRGPRAKAKTVAEEPMNEPEPESEGGDGLDG